MMQQDKVEYTKIVCSLSLLGFYNTLIKGYTRLISDKTKINNCSSSRGQVFFFGYSFNEADPYLGVLSSFKG